MALEVDPVIATAVAVQGPPVSLDLPEVLPFEGIKVCRKDLELGEKVELEVLGKSAHLRGADRIKDDLEHVGQAKRNVEIRKSGKSRGMQGMNRMRIGKRTVTGIVHFIPLIHFIPVKISKKTILSASDRCGRTLRSGRSGPATRARSSGY